MDIKLIFVRPLCRVCTNRSEVAIVYCRTCYEYVRISRIQCKRFFANNSNQHRFRVRIKFIQNHALGNNNIKKSSSLNRLISNKSHLRFIEKGKIGQN